MTTKQITMSYDEYLELIEEQLRLKKQFKNMFKGANELGEFLSFLGKTLDFKREVEEFNEQSTNSDIIENDGQYKVRIKPDAGTDIQD